MNDAASNPETRVSNPFGSPVVAERQASALVAVEQQRAIAEIQAAMVVARSHPRDKIKAMDDILNACTRSTLAEKALYTYARGGTEITGPSIRLAEALAQNWGNIKTSVRELEQRGGMSTVQTIALDLETGYQSEKVFQVTHTRDTKKGSYALTDARDIYELVANQGARRLRACILAVIPGDVIEAAIRQCDVTLKTKAEVTPERLQSLLEKFAAHGVVQSQIELRIQRRLETMLPAQMLSLGKIFNSISDGMSVPGDWFEPLPTDGPGVEAAGPKTGASALKDAAAKRAKDGSKGKPNGEAGAGTPDPKSETQGPRDDKIGVRGETTSVAQGETIDPETGEITAKGGTAAGPNGAPRIPPAAEWFERCLTAKTVEQVNVLQGFIGAKVEGQVSYSEEDNVKMSALAKERIAILEKK